jgi:hypothetical protein
MSKGKTIGAILAVIIVALIIWQSLSIISVINSSSPSNPFPDYTKVRLVANQTNSVQFGYNVYGLVYTGPQIDPITQKQVFQFAVAPPPASTPAIESKTFDAAQGAKYDYSGIEIIVGEVHNDYLILYIKFAGVGVGTSILVILLLVAGLVGILILAAILHPHEPQQIPPPPPIGI